MRKEDVQTALVLSLPVIVFVVFLILKLTGVISWSWWWVTSPLWMVTCLILVLSVAYVSVFVFRYRKSHDHRR